MTLPTYFISHGGGPWPYMDELRNVMRGIELSLKDIPRQIGVTPKAVLVISGHWEDAVFSVMASAQPPMVYDYEGFPEYTYRVIYPAAGAPALAVRVHALIESAGLPTRLDSDQGFDHGTFAPLAVMYPEGDVPVIQLSLQSGLDPAQHFQLGQALTPLRDEGVLIVGSGMSYHNLRRLGPSGRAPSMVFDDWLQSTLTSSSAADRLARLVDWSNAPAARLAHPREDHLLPLMVAVGAASTEPGICTYHEDTLFGGVTASSFRFGQAANG